MHDQYIHPALFYQLVTQNVYSILSVLGCSLAYKDGIKSQFKSFAPPSTYFALPFSWLNFSTISLLFYISHHFQDWLYLRTEWMGVYN